MATPLATVLTGVHPGWAGTVVDVTATGEEEGGPGRVVLGLA
ncbi:MAG TPA: hypothetical protein VII76_10890 [Acidimicrobiales bacterium]